MQACGSRPRRASVLESIGIIASAVTMKNANTPISAIILITAQSGSPGQFLQVASMPRHRRHSAGSKVSVSYSGPIHEMHGGYASHVVARIGKSVQTQQTWP